MTEDFDATTWFNSLPDEQKKVALSEGLGARILHDGLNYAVPIWWVATDSEYRLSLRSGTAFLVDCGCGVFAVTAEHVFRQYRADKRAAKEIACQIGNALFDPDEHLIAFDPELDVATFRLSATDVTAIGKPTISASATTWPPRSADEGNFAFFAGFPAPSRGISSTGHFLAAVPYMAMTPITVITERQITCRFDRKKWVDIGGQGLPPVGYEIGGVSGGPLLIPTLEGNGTVAWRLGGVIVEAAHGELFEAVVAVRADHIRPDGRLTPMIATTDVQFPGTSLPLPLDLH